MGRGLCVDEFQMECVTSVGFADSKVYTYKHMFAILIFNLYCNRILLFILGFLNMIVPFKIEYF